MIDRSKIKKMYVWNKECDNKLKRYVVVKNSDGSCYAVDYPREVVWENNMTSPIALVPYLHCEGIPEEKYRPFKAEETSEEFFGYLFRKTTDGKIYRITTIDYDSELCIRVSDGWMSLEHLFNNYKVKKPVYSVNNDGTITKTYTDWMIAGVKED